MNQSITRDRPLATFALFAYNQEKYIQEAIKGAFSQTYGPLEIILSDDCSTDQTFEIMREMAAAYKGPHRVRVEQTSSNLGRDRFGLRVSSLLQKSQGAFIILAAGDDISEAHRVETLFQKWDDNGRKAVCIHSRAQPIDESGRPSGEEIGDNKIAALSLPGFISQDGRGLLGATNAISRSLLDLFGPLPDVIMMEDGALGFRAHLADGIIFVDQPLVKYRRHDNNLTNQAELRERRGIEAFSRRLAGQHLCYLGDYIRSGRHLDAEVFLQASRRFREIAKMSQLFDRSITKRCIASLAYSKRLPMKRRLWLLLNAAGLIRTSSVK